MADHRYRVIKRLEAGGMAEVYLGEASSLEGFKKRVAIKRVLPHLAQNENFIQMFLEPFQHTVIELPKYDNT